MLPSWTDPGRGHRLSGAGQGVRRRRRPGHAGGARRRRARRGDRPRAGREAAAAFGDGTVFCERYVERGRHIEVQVFADTHGTVVALGERECSIQRRHQKIIEESPSPAVSTTLRGPTVRRGRSPRPGRSATSAPARSSSCSPRTATFYFLEMNTRLQVEHPVTECVTGLDLVRLQLLVAEGEPLPFTAAAAAPWARHRGPALRRGPGAGLAARHRDPAPLRGPGGRTAAFQPLAPAGPAAGQRRSRTASRSARYYDPMLAKVIAWAPTRAEAARLLADVAGPGPDARRAHQPRPARPGAAERRRSSPATPTPRSSTATRRSSPPLLHPRRPAQLACLAAALAGAARRRGQSRRWARAAGWLAQRGVGPQTRSYTARRQHRSR